MQIAATKTTCSEGRQWHFPKGWWLLPAIVVGTAIWVRLAFALFG